MNKEIIKSCDCNKDCNICDDYNVCACHGESNCVPRIGIVVTKRFGAPRYDEAPELLINPQKPLRMACPPRHRRFIERIFKLVKNGQEEDL